MPNSNPSSNPDAAPSTIPDTAPDIAPDIAALDALTADFFGAFDNRGGKPADVARVRRLMLPKGVVVITRPEFTALSVDEFVGPREKLLSEGRLVVFSEWETSARTEVVGDLATRFLEYRKSGLLDGTPYEGGGTKTIQYVRTPDGWRISAFAWFDEA
ncbi:hypothetical protein GCM10023205_35360 [Yinghuangia aomiensis]|uniref:DUF4440 domain-containing protein n=1 Tax=Yinghuangia aomiensis TaxID=676205 RepID=A0ABP9HCE1_9ACTN